RSDYGYGMPLDYGGWFLWRDLLDVGTSSIRSSELPTLLPFDLHNVCLLASMGVDDNNGFSFPFC
ncbi:MAG: hypothetical protein ACKPKO_19450, partial [Candidatus Fonsibacter sp.]